ncbi:multipass membrane protein [Candidatus Mancarchaeum acidiphilum]|uniref:Multipass membrane protein n=1 Tax=Candidatus Mancarchaeum acidiphilum TaxID=1920749 RepID=A0A218NNH1_9ARCH|nr:hypothetical protein [Candidatus Mancarchaeum acidiphilum]ASI14027.1 multipass membrane protein [Candidatus Mancarchaeum acidiphilum]
MDYRFWNYSLKVYRSNFKLFLFFSIAFLIAFLIPLFASVPAYSDLGSIYLRSSSVYFGSSILGFIVIIISTLFSLLFLSFAIVSINLIVKQQRTSVKLSSKMLKGIEVYISRVFVLLLIFTFVIMGVNLSMYGSGFDGIATAVAILILTPFFIYTPSSIVIEDRKVINAILFGSRFLFKKFGYFLIFLVFGIVSLSVVGFVFDLIPNPVISGYMQLIVDSLFVLPFLVLLLSEMYISKFAMLK